MAEDPLRREGPRIAAFLALAALAIGILWTVDSASEVERWTEVRIVDPWGERGAFRYEPLLANGSGALPMGAPGYFTHDAPTVRVRFGWLLEDERATHVAASGEMRLVVSAPAEPGRAAWTHVVPLENATLSGAPDEMAMESLLYLPGIAAEIGRDLSDATWQVVATVRFTSAPSSDHASDESAYTLPITYRPPLYSFPPDDALETRKDHTQRDAIPHEARVGLRGIQTNPLGPVLLLAGLVGFYATRRVSLEDGA